MLSVRREALGAVVALQREIAEKTLDDRTVLRRVIEVAQAVTNAAGALFAFAEDSELVCPIACGVAAAGEGRSIAIEGSFVGEVVRTGRTLHYADTSTERRADPALCALFGARSGISAPLHHDGRVAGALLVVSPEPAAFDEEHVALIELLACVSAASLSRAAEQTARTKLQSVQARYAALFHELPVPTWLFDARTLRILAVNDAAVRIYGWTHEEFLTLTALDLDADRDKKRDHERTPEMPTEFAFAGTWRHRRKDGKELFVEVHTSSFDDDGRLLRIAVAEDVTDRARLEDDLRQAHKAEATGRLAGAIAHDFNNLLSVILAETDDVLEQLEPAHEWRPQLENVKAAGMRAADLTRQLLAYGGRQRLEPNAVQLNSVLRGSWQTLTDLVGTRTKVVFELDPDLGLVDVDRRKLEQVLLDLVVNARDAMPEGGQLTILTRNVELDDGAARAAGGMSPGPAALLSISDTGLGMDSETAARALDPFFTTKQDAKSAGLGLSTALGLMRQSGGTLTLESAPGRGTTITLLLPRRAATASAPPPAAHKSSQVRITPRGKPSPPGVAAVAPVKPRGVVRILVVDDDDRVRATVSRILRSRSYVVDEAADGEEALVTLAQAERPYDLVLSDVRMPRLDGPSLGARLRELHPEVRLLFMSAYTAETVPRTPEAEVVLRTTRFLQKPFTPTQLLETVALTLALPKAESA